MKGIKMLLVSAFAAVALAALPVASSASGGVDLQLEGGAISGGDPRLTASEYPVQISGEELDFEVEGLKPGETVPFEASSGHPRTECSVEYDAGEASGALYSLTLDATYSECQFAGVETQVDMNSCRYAFTDFYTSSLFLAHGSIACNEGDVISVDIGGICEVEIPAQVVSESAQLAGPPTESFAGKVAAALGTDSLQHTITSLWEGPLCALVGLEEGSYEDGNARSHIELFGVQPD